MSTATPEKQRIIKAVNELGRRVTAADVAARTGLPLNTAAAGLNGIAAEAGGHLEIGTKGGIAYSFAPGFQNYYLATGLRRLLEQTGSWLAKTGFFLLRISFGIMLILSLLAIAVLFFVIVMRGSGSRDDNRVRIDFGFFDWMVLRELFWWGTYAAYPGPGAVGARRRSSFLTNCFSFLFGDGDPNASLADRKWKSIAQVIRKNDGVVTSDHLAPFTGARPGDEDAMLPVLVRFDGRPEVTETGNIVYVFPSMQVSAGIAAGGDLPRYLRESPWKFSNAPQEALVPVYVLAAINFLGSWWLFLQTALSPALLPLTVVTVPLMMYGTFFVVLPALRWLALNVKNERIESRNRTRESYAQRLASPPEDLEKKLLEARQFKVGAERITAGDVVYTTEKDLLDQEFD